MAEITNIDAFRSALEEMKTRVYDAARHIVEDGEALVDRKAKANMGGPGPMVRSGTLWRSIRPTIPVPTAAGWLGSVAPHTVYARIQELGGTIFAKNHPYLVFRIDGHWVRKKHVTLPPRPYMRPAVEEARPEYEAIAAARWARALKG